MSSPKLAFLGVGNMATAIVRGLLAKKAWRASEIRCTSRTGVTAQKLAHETKILHEPDLPKLLAPADLVVIAFKPQSLDDADPRLAELTAGKLVLSVLAGKRLARLRKTFPKARNIVRTMPNTPAAIGAGMTAYCSLLPFTPGDRAVVERFLGAFGKSEELREKHMNAITALSGSGPAFLFEYVAAMREAGISAGLSRKVAAKVALETTLGAARLLARSTETPEDLRNKVTSPKGTTYAGLQVLEQLRFRDTIKETILAATRRAGELSKD